MMDGIMRYNASDLVLKVRDNYDHSKFKIEEWEDYLDILCGNRFYQKEAIKTAVIYLASGEYASINYLAEESYKNNKEIQEKYRTFSDFEKQLPIKNKLSGVIDLATGTGKSYVIYGIAQIMLSLQIVKKVLVLCPSITIEDELKNKFKKLSGDVRLKASIPEDVMFKNPRIIDANNTIKEGDICVENIHAVYENTGSSIQDSMQKCGNETLVLSDEVHHVYNSTSESDIRKWKLFLTNSKYGFKYLLGFTGTAYIDNEYFSDVIYRYSLRKAIDDGFVKLVEYVAEDESIGQYEKFQKIYDNHQEFKRKYSNLKPLTIFITKDIKSAGYLCEDFLGFLVEKEMRNKESLEDKVLVVTSSQKHKKNVIALKTVDEIGNPSEWIFSVSMLTEGWDVKNVFQIVPWEDRAFDSKLLIAQVLGRGLRIPENVPGQPKVRVFNHANWSSKIQSLVDEILEMEMQLSSKVIIDNERDKYNFQLHTIDYTKIERTVEKKDHKQPEVFDLRDGIKLLSQIESETKKTEYEDVKGSILTKTTKVLKETVSVTEVINKIVESFKGRALEAKLIFPSGEYQKEKLPSIEDIRAFIERSMNSCGIKGDQLTIENAEKIYGRFTALLRSKPSTPEFQKAVNSIISISTKSMKNETVRYSTIKRDMTLFVSQEYKSEFTKEECIEFDAIADELKLKQVRKINKYNFKTPVNIVFANMEPEKKFIEFIVRGVFSSQFVAGLRSRDMGCYSIDYKQNIGSKFQSFNPDFFLLIGDKVVVVEIKSDNDVSDENKAKYRATKRHFETLNLELEKHGETVRKYYFCFLSPIDYNTFAEYLKDGRMFTSNFRSKLEDLLEKNND